MELSGAMKSKEKLTYVGKQKYSLKQQDCCVGYIVYRTKMYMIAQRKEVRRGKL